MWTQVAKGGSRFIIEYFSGFVCAVICFVLAVAVIGGILSVAGMPGGAVVGFVVMAGVFIGIPLGGTFGIVIIDKYVFKAVIKKRQIFFGSALSVVVSVCLTILDSYGVQIFYRLPHDGPNGLLGGFALFYIVGVLCALLGYTFLGKIK
jgi:hypothetical protein